MVKEERHGVPFGLYTCGIPSPDSSLSTIPLPELGLSCLRVSLLAGNPKDYATVTGRSDGNASFGQVCALIAEAAEQGVPVEVDVLQDYSAGATDLALSLGARHVHTF